MNRRTASAAGLVGLLLAATTGCVAWEESMCSDGEVPVFALGNPTGRDCVRAGRQAPPGYAFFPEDRVPQVPGDRYDRWPLAKRYPWADEVPDDVRRAAAGAGRTEGQGRG